MSLIFSRASLCSCRSLAAVWLILTAAAAPSSRLRADAVADVVITEIMYNPGSGDRREDYIELFNQGGQGYSLKDWRFEDGVIFTFPDVTLGAGQYLVVCADQARIRSIHGITNTVGNWDPASTLDNGGERLRLLDAAAVEIEDITFDDRNPWPILADGYGHSLEKRKPSGDNDNPANWAASQIGNGWTRVTVTGLATSSTLYVYLAGAGTAYIDDLQLYPVGNPGNNRIQNPGVETGLPPWTTAGTHSGSSSTTERAHGGTRSLKLVSTGTGTGAGQSVSQVNLGLTNGDPYTLEFWVFPTAPDQRIIARLSGTGGQIEPIYIETGGGGATPGRVNSVDTNDVPPFISDLEHAPSAPVISSTVTLVAVAEDDGAVADVTAHWDRGTGEQTAAMVDDGAHGDGAAGDGVYGVVIGTFGTGTIVRYWATVTDNGGKTGRYPFVGNPTPSLGLYVQPAGINPTFPLRSNSGLTSDLPPVYHILLSSQALQDLSNDPATYVQGTFIYNGRVFENIRVRHRGQTSLRTPKQHWKVDFNKDNRFRTPFDNHPEVDNINIQSSYGDKSFLREYLSYKAWIDVQKPGLEMWHVRMYLNGAYRGLYVHLETPDGDFLDRTGLDPDGWLWKSYSQAKGGTGGFEMEEDGGDPAEATSQLGEFINSMNSLGAGALDDFIFDNMDVASFIDFLAIHQLIHNCDHPAKNYLVYANEGNPVGSWTYLGWDMDLTHGRNYECGGGGVFNDTMRADMFGDPRLLFGTSARTKCDGPWNGVIDGFLNRSGGFREEFYARTEQLLEQLYHPNVLNPLIDDLAGPLHSEVERDWNANPPQYGTRSTHVYHTNQLKTVMQNRYTYISDALGSLNSPELTGLTCVREGSSARLTWNNNAADYVEVRVYRSGARLLTLPGNAEEALVPLDPTRPTNTFKVASLIGATERAGQSCSITFSAAGYSTVINQDFTPPATAAALSVNCDAQQVNGVLQLTQPVGDQRGAAFFTTKYPADDFIADFDVRFDEPSAPGADGLVFAMIRGTDPALCGGAGGALGFWESDAGGAVMSGHGIVFDTYQNAGEPSHNWCGAIDTNRRPSGAFNGVDVPEEFTGNGTFHVQVTGKAGTLTVRMGNFGIGMAERQILTYAIPNYSAEDLFFGFTAATGGAVARHIVDNFVLQVKTGAPPTLNAAFRANATSGEAPLAVNFLNDSTGASTFAWNFGDGGTSTAAAPSYTFQIPGKYTVSLTARSAAGATDTETKTDFINAALVLQADFTAGPTIGARPLAVQFADRSRHNAPISAYNWNFGDGSTSTQASPSHTYSQAGAFGVTLEIAGPGAATSEKTLPNYILVDDALAADFTAAPTTGAAPLAVSFTDASTGSTIRSWNWDFGDGMTSTLQNPKHTYSAFGTYTVKLLVTGFQETAETSKTGLVKVQGTGPLFQRGDATQDGTIDLTDPIYILEHLFLGGPALTCPDSGDVNDDGQLDVSDPITALDYLFRAGADPRPPFPAKGVDPTPDLLGTCQT